MSEAFQDEGQTPEADDQQPGAGAAAQNAELVSGDDFRARVASDPEFAWEQIVKRDQKVSEHMNRMKELEPFAKLMEVAGGAEQVQQHLTTLARIQQMPDLAELVTKSLMEGRVALPAQATGNAATEEDEWIDPDVKAAVDPVMAQVNALQEQLAQVTSQLNQTDLRSQERFVEQNTLGALEMFKSDPEALKEAQEVLEREVRATYQRAQGGEVQQAELYKQISAPGGQRILEGVLFDTYRKWAPRLVAASQTNNEPNADRVLGRATDPRPVNAARPGSVQQPELPKGKLGVNDVVKQMRAAGARIGVDTRQL